MLHDPNHLFYTMWGERGFQKRGPGHSGSCWRNLGSAAYFARVRELAAPMCDRNWFEGSLVGQAGQKNSRPTFPAGKAPALMGFDDTIRDYCNEQLGYVYPGEINHAIAAGCAQTNLNIMRVAQGWSMCMNLEWLLCATRGLLPGMGDERIIYFASAPNSLRNDDKALDNKGNWYNSGIVFFLEVCLLTQVCRNSEELLRVSRGDAFVCDLGDAAHRQRVAASLVRALSP